MREEPDARRRLLVGSALLGLGASCLAASTDPLATLLAQSTCPAADDPDELIATLPLFGHPRRDTPYGQIVGGAGRDARRFTDLSLVRPDRLLTPTPELFLRTAHPAAAEDALQSGITVRQGSRAQVLAIDDLIRRSRPQGAHLIECSGNNDPNDFGLMSVAAWDGVPLADILHGVRPDPRATGVLISGIDDEPQASRGSVAGASWIFPLTALDRTGAFLATRVNGAPLPLDHGAPVRLVVPGWYGCSWIKWVNEIRFVGDDAATTPQMREFAARTHQDGVPASARDYFPPEIEVAATPIRVEKRRIRGKMHYRVIGIVWGGHHPVERLAIRFGAGDSPKPLTVCPAPSTHRTWSLWEYDWRPAEPGIYDIALTVADQAVRTRRLDLSFYIRSVRIDEA